jgi:hypothetical protein
MNSARRARERARKTAPARRAAAIWKLEGDPCVAETDADFRREVAPQDWEVLSIAVARTCREQLSEVNVVFDLRSIEHAT